MLLILFCHAERSEASTPLLASCDAIIIIASGMFSNAAGGFLKTHSLEASEDGDSTQHLTTVMFEADNGHFLSVNLTVLLYVEIKCSQ